MDLLQRRVERAGRVVDLQPREFALLEHLMRNTGRALSKTYLLEQLWDSLIRSADKHRGCSSLPPA